MYRSTRNAKPEGGWEEEKEGIRSVDVLAMPPLTRNTG